MTNGSSNAKDLRRPMGKEEKSMYTKEKSLSTRWHWQVSANRADQHHSSHHQNKNWLQKSQHRSHVPSGQRGCTETHIQAKTQHCFCAQVLQHVWLSMSHPRQSTAQTTCPRRRYTKIRNLLILLRLTDVFQEQWNSIACFATCSSFSTILPPPTLGKGITQLHSQKERLPQAAAVEGSLSRACTTALKKNANHSIS